jgi:hypothetical protein
MSQEDALRLAVVFNTIVSAVIEATPAYSVKVSRQAILAEIGTELQGTWANIQGQGAAREVQKMLAEYVVSKGIGRRKGKQIELNNGWSIVFGTEPDVAFRDPTGKTRIAIEIKGSLDTAGAQTRYGEAKKTFGKQLEGNPRCHTVYLASCYTDSVIRQIERDGQVRDWFNLTSILYDAAERAMFLRKLFHTAMPPNGKAKPKGSGRE